MVVLVLVPVVVSVRSLDTGNGDRSRQDTAQKVATVRGHGFDARSKNRMNACAGQDGIIVRTIDPCITNVLSEA